MFMTIGSRLARFAPLAIATALAACGEEPTAPQDDCTGVTLASVATGAPTGSGQAAEEQLGGYTRRYTAEVAVRGGLAYTSTWGARFANGAFSQGNAILVWDVSGAAPALLDSVVIAGAGVGDVGDVAVSADGRWLVAATEYSELALVVYDLADPRRPREVSRFTPRCQGVGDGAHTAEIGVVNGTLYAVLAANAGVSTGSRVVIVDLGDPARPREVFSKRLPGTFLHDSHLRDGVLFLALWDAGLAIWDLGGLGRGGAPDRPIEVGSMQTQGGNVHNAWWLHDPATGARRWVIVGEESTTGVSVLRNSRGDIHVVDMQDPSNPREVAFHHAPDHNGEPVGTHNFSVDEARGVLYAAMYNGGVHALDVRGDLGACSEEHRDAAGRCDLGSAGRVLATMLQSTTAPFRPYIWGVAHQGDFVYASDMANGLWKLPAVVR